MCFTNYWLWAAIVMATMSTEFWFKRKSLVKADWWPVTGWVELWSDWREWWTTWLSCFWTTPTKAGEVKTLRKSYSLYLDLSKRTGGDLVILQRWRRDRPTGVKGLGKWRHLGTGRDLHAGKLGGIELLQGGGKSVKAFTSKRSKHSKISLFSSYSAPVWIHFPPFLSFTSFLSFHEAGRESPSKVLTVFQRQNPERDSSLKNHTKMAFSQNTWSPCFPLITHRHTLMHTLGASVLAEISFLRSTQLPLEVSGLWFVSMQPCECPHSTIYETQPQLDHHHTGVIKALKPAQRALT